MYNFSSISEYIFCSNVISDKVLCDEEDDGAKKDLQSSIVTSSLQKTLAMAGATFVERRSGSMLSDVSSCWQNPRHPKCFPLAQGSRSAPISAPRLLTLQHMCQRQNFSNDKQQTEKAKFWREQTRSANSRRKSYCSR